MVQGIRGEYHQVLLGGKDRIPHINESVIIHYRITAFLFQIIKEDFMPVAVDGFIGYFGTIHGKTIAIVMAAGMGNQLLILAVAVHHHEI